MASFQDEKTNVWLICYFVSPIRLAHFVSVVGEELPPFPPLTACHWRQRTTAAGGRVQVSWGGIHQ